MTDKAWAAAVTISQLRKLTADEVEFECSNEPEELQVEGNYMCTGDDEADRQDEQELLARLRRGDESAWCILVVKAKWRNYEGSATLGGYVFPEGNTGEQNQEYAKEEYEQLRQDALEDLNERLLQIIRENQILELELAPKPE